MMKTRWFVMFQVLRDAPLTGAEIQAVRQLVQRHRQPPWDGGGFALHLSRACRPDRVLVYGTATPIPSLDKSRDADRLVTMITELGRLLPGGEVRISDDFCVLGWDSAQQICVLGLEVYPTEEPLLLLDLAGLEDAELEAPVPMQARRQHAGGR